MSGFALGRCAQYQLRISAAWRAPITNGVKTLGEPDTARERAQDAVGIEELKGQTLAKIERRGDDEVLFETVDGVHFRMWHSQDCCETVVLQEVIGNLDDLIGAPIAEAEEASGSNDGTVPSGSESYTWTFYKLGTAKGHVTLRWLGESNGYYSESVEFDKLVN